MPAIWCQMQANASCRGLAHGVHGALAFVPPDPVIARAAKACPCEGEGNLARISCECTMEIASLRSQ